uniref:Uncharacterized protein n=1 Tax=Opuntia streptacantha TaxID=393608 RepID=A0A7C8ZP74_OPUST
MRFNEIVYVYFLPLFSISISNGQQLINILALFFSAMCMMSFISIIVLSFHMPYSSTTYIMQFFNLINETQIIRKENVDLLSVKNNVNSKSGSYIINVLLKFLLG